MPNEEMHQIIEKNQEILDSLDKRLGRIEKRFTLNTIFGFIKAAVIILPIIAGIIYLSPIVKRYVDTIKPYLQAFNIGGSGETQVDNQSAVNLDLLSPETRSMFCDEQIRETLVQQNCPTN